MYSHHAYYTCQSDVILELYVEAAKGKSNSSQVEACPLTLTLLQRSSEGIEIPGMTVGRATIQSIINALEWEHSRNAHCYPDEADTKINLCSDDRVKQIETAIKHNEPFRVMLSQARKANGISAGTNYNTFILGDDDVNTYNLLLKILTLASKC